jgi:hypothetical protein
VPRRQNPVPAGLQQRLPAISPLSSAYHCAKLTGDFPLRPQTEASRALMPTSALPQPLPATLSPPSSTPAPAVECLIGELVATAACLVARGLRELKESGQIRMSADARQMGGELMSVLVTVREATTGKLDFDRVARTHGARVLRERCDGAVSQRTIDELVAAVLEILVSIVRLRLN